MKTAMTRVRRRTPEIEDTARNVAELMAGIVRRTRLVLEDGRRGRRARMAAARFRGMTDALAGTARILDKDPEPGGVIQPEFQRFMCSRNCAFDLRTCLNDFEDGHRSGILDPGTGGDEDDPLHDLGCYLEYWACWATCLSEKT